MKRLVLSTLAVVALVGCGKQSTPENTVEMDVNRLAMVSASSSSSDMRQESSVLKTKIDTINNYGTLITNLCDFIDDRIEAFNAALLVQEKKMTVLQGQQQVLLDQLAPLVSRAAIYAVNRDAIVGQMTAYNNRILFLSSPSTAQAQIAKAKRDLLPQRAKARLLRSAALRALAAASYPSPQYEQADANVGLYSSQIANLEAQIGVLAKVVSANIQSEISALQTNLPSLQRDYSIAVTYLNDVLNQVRPLQSQLSGVNAQIAAIPTSGNLKPIYLPRNCNKL